MKITFLVPHLRISGGVKMIVKYANKLTSRGHRVTIICPESNIDYYYLRNFRIPYPNCLLKNLFSFLPDWINVKCRVRYVPSFDAKFIPNGDIIFATAWHTAKFVKEYPISKGKKFYFIQGYEANIFGPKNEVDETYKYPFVKIVVSSWLKNLLREQFGEDAFLIINPIDTKEFYPIENKAITSSRICLLDHVVEWKGIDVGIKAIKIVKEKYPNVKLISFGAHNRTVNYADEYYYKPSVDRLREIYNSCDIFLCPSWVEGFGLPSVESMACKCALVTTDNGGCRDFAIHGKTALVAEPGDYETLARHIVRLLDNRQLLNQIAQQGFKLVSTFSWDKAIDKMEEIIMGRYE